MSRPTRRVAIALAALVLAAAGAAAQTVEPEPADLAGVGVDPRLDGALPLDLVFQDEQGRQVALGQFFSSERPVVLALVYYRCPMLCSLVLDGLVRALGAVEPQPGREIEVVTVSIDPRETPDLARQKKATLVASYGRPESAAGWHALTGRQAEITALAAAVGFRYRYLEDRGEYAHPATLIVITPEGRISRYLSGVDHDPQTFRLSLVEASEGKIGTVVDDFLLYCYRYDPATGRYTPVAWAVMRLGGLLSVLLLGGFLLRFWLRDAWRAAKGTSG